MTQKVYLSVVNWRTYLCLKKSRKSWKQLLCLCVRWTVECFIVSCRSFSWVRNDEGPKIEPSNTL